MTEPYEPIPVAPRFVERDLPLCPVCRVLVRRLLDEPVPTYNCDLHGRQTPVWERYEVPTGDET